MNDYSGYPFLRSCSNPYCLNPNCKCGNHCQCTPGNQCRDHPTQTLCEQFAHLLGGKGNFHQDICTVSLKRNIRVTVQGRPSTTVVPADVLFESIDSNGNALNLAEIAILQEEIPVFIYAITQQSLIVSALHNHWIFMEPMILYVHIQSVEPPLQFAKKLAYAFSTLTSSPIPE